MLESYIFLTIGTNIVWVLVLFFVGANHVSKLRKALEGAGRKIPFPAPYGKEDSLEELINRSPFKKSEWSLIPYLFSAQDDDIDQIRKCKRWTLVCFVGLVISFVNFTITPICLLLSALAHSRGWI